MRLERFFANLQKDLQSSCFFSSLYVSIGHISWHICRRR